MLSPRLRFSTSGVSFALSKITREEPTYLSLRAKECQTVLDSGFHVTGFKIFVRGTWIFKTLNDRQSILLAESLRSFLDKSGKGKEERGKRKTESGKRKAESGKRKEEGVLSVTNHGFVLWEPSVSQTLNLRYL